MKIFFLSTVSPSDRRSWSGITSQLFRLLADGNDIVWSGTPVFTFRERIVIRLLQGWRTFLGYKFTDQNTSYARSLSCWAKRRLQLSGADIVVVASGEPETFAFLKTALPIVYVADATYALKRNYYPWYTGLSKAYDKQAERIEALAIAKATHIFYSSSWAAASAINHYGASPDKISICPFGPNTNVIGAYKNHQDKQALQLLFIGHDWERKGGADAIEVYRRLRKKFPCTLHVIGADPSLNEEGIKVYPYADKNRPDEETRYNEILSFSDIMLMPSKADCTPVVLSEAAAFGLPVICYDTGGVSTVVKNGITGYCLPMDGGSASLADFVEKLWVDKDEFSKMRKAARKEYETSLNWDNWRHLFHRVLCKLVPNQ